MIPCIMHEIFFKCCNRTYHSRYWNNFERSTTVLLEVAVLQQHLSFTVLKLVFIEFDIPLFNLSCNNVYHLRYTSQSERQQRNKSTMKYTHCKYLNKVKLKRKWYGNSAYRLRYWNFKPVCVLFHSTGCNSTYRLRYWNAPNIPQVTVICFLYCNSLYRL